MTAGEPKGKRAKTSADSMAAKLLAISLSADRLSPSSPVAARKRLEDLALSLKENNFEWAAAAISSYLVGKFKTLDEALGTKPVALRGRKRTTAADLQARDIFVRRLAGESWKSIADALKRDERELRRIYGPRKAQLLSEETTRRLNAKFPYRRSKPGL